MKLPSSESYQRENSYKRWKGALPHHRRPLLMGHSIQLAVNSPKDNKTAGGTQLSKLLILADGL